MDSLTAAEGAGEEFLAVDAAHMLAIADTERTMAWNRRALDMIDAASDPRARRWSGSLHNNIGWTLHDQGDYVGALRHFRLALAAYSETGKPEQVQVAHWAVARGLRSLGRRRRGPGDPAPAARRGPLRRLCRGGTRRAVPQCWRDRPARSHFAAAAALLGADPWIADNEPERLARLRELSDPARPDG